MFPRRMFAATCCKLQAGSLRFPKFRTSLIFKIAPANRRAHDAPPEGRQREWCDRQTPDISRGLCRRLKRDRAAAPSPPHVELLLRSEEHTSELQSLRHLV